MFDTKSTQRLGNDGFVWFYGVVEDIEDPHQLGRMRVRVLGDHTQSKKNIPTEDLPWAYLINDVHSSSMNGIGTSPTGLCVLGSWVFGFYSDGIDKQQPCVVGSFGGIPESISWKPGEVGFQDPNEEFPLPNRVFEQDTNILARNSPDDHAFEIPEELVPEQEKMIEGGLCPKKPVYGKKYYDKFDEAYVRKFGQGEEEKHSCDDTVVGNSDCGTTELKVEDKEDDKCQYFLETNNHPFTVYKFINKERFIPKAKVFADEMHREVWHEPDNPWAATYPYNKVWEGYHKVGTTTVNNPGEKGTGTFVTEAYGYDKSIENYDGSDKEGIYRKQSCGIGSWGLGEEWDQTEGSQRYHRFTPSGNYFEIDNDGNETRKIYGDQFEIDLKDKTILIKGDWNITVEGDKNELIEGDYNLQIMKDFNIDIRTDLKVHTDGKAEYHHKDDYRVRIDGEERRRVNGKRETSILTDDYIETPKHEMRADEIYRYGGKAMVDEAFVLYELKAHDMEMSVCTLDSQIETWNNVNKTKTNDIIDFSERITNHDKDVMLFDEDIMHHTVSWGTLVESSGAHTETHSSHAETIGSHSETCGVYHGCFTYWGVTTVDFEVYYRDILLFEKVEVPDWTCEAGDGEFVPLLPIVMIPDFVEVGSAEYPETDGISQCLRQYNLCIDAAKGACMTTLKDPRTLEDITRFDWEKYHDSMESCKLAYEACVEANVGLTCNVCAPAPGELVWDCMVCHDPNCPPDPPEKVWEFYKCDCECHDKQEEEKIDPWDECEREEP